MLVDKRLRFMKNENGASRSIVSSPFFKPDPANGRALLSACVIECVRYVEMVFVACVHHLQCVVGVRKTKNI